MIPRRKILLWSEREDQAGELAFILNTQLRFIVTKASDDREFQSLLAQQWDLVIIPHAWTPLKTAARAALAKRLSDCRVLIITLEYNYSAPNPPEADWVLPFGASSAEIIDRCYFLTARKRGPKHDRKDVEAVSTIAVKEVSLGQAI